MGGLWLLLVIFIFNNSKVFFFIITELYGVNDIPSLNIKTLNLKHLPLFGGYYVLNPDCIVL